MDVLDGGPNVTRKWEEFDQAIDVLAA